MDSPVTEHASEAPRQDFILGFWAIGAPWEIATPAPLGWELHERIFSRISEFDATYSRFRSDSLVAQISTAPRGGTFHFPEDSVPLFDLYDRLHSATDGGVDPLVGRDLELLGYDSAYSLILASPAVRAWAHGDARPRWSTEVVRDGTTLTTCRPLVIDVGAAGKGYLVDIVSGLLREAGHTQFVVDGSGDLRHQGEERLVVGLEHPFDAERVVGTIDLQNAAVCASAVNRRAWGPGLHHVLDGRTGRPVSDVAATWVVANDALTADGWATALFFSVPRGVAEQECAYVRMFVDGRAEVSPNFRGEVFS